MNTVYCSLFFTVTSHIRTAHLAPDCCSAPNAYSARQNHRRHRSLVFHFLLPQSALSEHNFTFSASHEWHSRNKASRTLAIILKVDHRLLSPRSDLSTTVCFAYVTYALNTSAACATVVNYHCEWGKPTATIRLFWDEYRSLFRQSSAQGLSLCWPSTCVFPAYQSTYKWRWLSSELLRRVLW
jgi:hypothetical protein